MAAPSTSEDVLRREPRRVESRSVLRNAYASRSLALAALGKYKEALPDVERALELEGNGPRRGRVLLNRALVLAHLGDHQRAAADVEALIRSRRLTGPESYDTACVLSLASATARGDAHLAPDVAARRVESSPTGPSNCLTQPTQRGTSLRPVPCETSSVTLTSTRFGTAEFQSALSDWTFPVNPFTP